MSLLQSKKPDLEEGGRGDLPLHHLEEGRKDLSLEGGRRALSLQDLEEGRGELFGQCRDLLLEPPEHLERCGPV